MALKRSNGTIKSYRMHVANTYIPMLEWCKRVTGLGRLDVYERRQPHHLPIGTWKVHGVKAASVMKQILPYMIVKKEKAIVAVAAMRS